MAGRFPRRPASMHLLLPTDCHTGGMRAAEAAHRCGEPRKSIVGLPHNAIPFRACRRGQGAPDAGDTVIPKPESWNQLWSHWAVLSYYQRFEGLVALVLTLVIALIILVALFRLTSGVVTGLLLGALDPLDHGVFQAVFGEILTLLIALEFNHTLQYVVKREQSIIQTKIVLLIALLAVSRKVIVLDLRSVDAPQLFALAAITLALGVAYWQVRERDARIDAGSHDDPA
jgi:uncharacterized membrane protein (DUF373 family)